MNRRLLAALLVAGVVGLMMLSCNPSQQPANAQAGAKAQQWEYQVVYIEGQLTVAPGLDPKNWEKTASNATDFYNKLGADGWEYVGQTAPVFAVFKRPKR
jgi:hypothetical protein